MSKKGSASNDWSDFFDNDGVEEDDDFFDGDDVSDDEGGDDEDDFDELHDIFGDEENPAFDCYMSLYPENFNFVTEALKIKDREETAKAAVRTVEKFLERPNPWGSEVEFESAVIGELEQLIKMPPCDTRENAIAEESIRFIAALSARLDQKITFVLARALLELKTSSDEEYTDLREIVYDE